MTRKIITWAIGIVITALYAYMVIAAVGNALLLPDMAAALSLTISVTGWFWLVVGIAVPVIAFGIALLFGRGRGAGIRLLLLFTGLCVAAAIQLELLHLVPQSSYFG